MRSLFRAAVLAAAGLAGAAGMAAAQATLYRSGAFTVTCWTLLRRRTGRRESRLRNGLSVCGR